MGKKGFTVIELLLVIAIVLFIAALMSPVLWSVRKKALVVSCQSNLRQIDIYLRSYAIENDGNIPRTCEDVEARNHPKKLRDPQTRIRSLKGFIRYMARTDPGALRILRCPADGGSDGLYYSASVPCWEAFGQSQQVNVEMFVDTSAPWYNRNYDGPMYGASPVKRDWVRNDGREASKYMVLSDMWSHWHNGIAVDGETTGHFVNILYFDEHVSGRVFESSLDARRFLDMNATKRWWLEPEPEAH